MSGRAVDRGRDPDDAGAPEPSAERAAERSLEAVARLLARRVGLRLDHAIRARLVNAVHDEAERRGLGLDAYVTALDGDPVALQDLLNRVTVQETAFFRDPGQFAVLAGEVLPALRAQGGPVQIWSAGCANGQEAYSLAMTLAESGIEQAAVIASDLSTDAVGRTRRARYTDREVTGLSEIRRARHLVPVTGADPAGQRWEIAHELRARVRVVRHNLVSELPPWSPGACQIVFCRNVLIYFDRASVVALLDRLAEWMPSGAYLFLGYSESLWQVSDAFSLVRFGDAFAYRNDRRAPFVAWPGTTAGAADTGSSTTTTVQPPAADGLGAASAPRVPHPIPPLAEPAPRASVGGAVRRADPVPVTEAVPPPRHALFARGTAAFDRGDHAAAISAFRQAVYLDPDDPVAHLNLALALDASGDEAAARRAYGAGRAALARCDPVAVEAALEGYHLDELTRLLERRSE
jgi:chemotaxis methyl-accepting protein methylase